MARGWESKSVEAQQAEASEKPGTRQPPMTPAEATRHREMEGLRLSRQRILTELSAQQDSRRRKMLEQALADLEQKIAKLAADGGTVDRYSAESAESADLRRPTE